MNLTRLSPFLSIFCLCAGKAWERGYTCSTFPLIYYVYILVLVSILMLIGCNALSIITAPPAPSNVMVAHVSGTTIRVSWQPLSLVEARGHITYRVMVTPTTGSRRRRQATQGERVCTLLSPCEVPANESSAIVVGLDRDTSYSVTVMAVNSDDEAGPTSVPIAATIPSRVKHFRVLDVAYRCMQVIKVDPLYSRQFLDSALIK